MWIIHVLNGSLKGEHIAPDLRVALAVASVLIREGIVVERIDGPDGLTLDARALCAMLDRPES